MLPIALAIVLIKALPESVRFLSVRGTDPERDGGDRAAHRARARRPRAPARAGSERAQKAWPSSTCSPKDARLGTMLLWIPFFMNLLILYFILSWLPGLLRQAGMPVSAGITAVMVFSVGGIIGTMLQGPLMKRWASTRRLSPSSSGSLVLIWLASRSSRTSP